MGTSIRLRMAGRGLLAGAALASLACLGVAAPATASSRTAPGIGSSPARGAAGSWGRAIPVPGLRALNRGGNAQVSALSCAARGSCAAGGYYRVSGSGGPNPDKADRGFVASERHGRWGRAIRVPGLAALSAGRQSSVDSVSCGAAGSCAVGGDYWRHGHQGFVAAERNGRWGRAIKMSGPVSSVSCAPAGTCAAGGTYTDSESHQQGFVAAGKNGRWGQPIEVPGLAALNAGGNAAVYSVSCAPADNCAAAGTYTDSDGHRQGFVAAGKNGVWGQAIEVPGLAALNAGGNAAVYSVSCAPAGNCAAGGTYRDGDGNQQAFVASENNGVWGPATDLPGLAVLDTGGDQYPDDSVGSVSCASAGNCAAGGTFGSPYPWGFAASEKNGVWGKVIVMPGLTARAAGVSSVSCAPAGNCAADGWYFPDISLGFVTAERNGRWGQAIEVPGLRALNKGYVLNAAADTVSCPPAGSCTAGGGYTDSHNRQQGFVT